MQGMREMLLLCPDRSVRVAMRGFYLHLLGILAETEGDRCEERSWKGTKKYGTDERRPLLSDMYSSRWIVWFVHLVTAGGQFVGGIAGSGTRF